MTKKITRQEQALAIVLHDAKKWGDLDNMTQADINQEVDDILLGWEADDVWQIQTFGQ